MTDPRIADELLQDLDDTANDALRTLGEGSKVQIGARILADLLVDLYHARNAADDATPLGAFMDACVPAPDPAHKPRRFPDVPLGPPSMAGARVPPVAAPERGAQKVRVAAPVSCTETIAHLLAEYEEACGPRAPFCATIRGMLYDAWKAGNAVSNDAPSGAADANGPEAGPEAPSGPTSGPASGGGGAATSEGREPDALEVEALQRFARSRQAEAKRFDALCWVEADVLLALLG